MEKGLLARGAELLGRKAKLEDTFAQDEGHRTASEVLADLRAQEHENDERIAELVASSEQTARSDVLDDRARRLIEGKAAEPTRPEKLRADLTEAYDRRVVLQRAIAMQRATVRTEHERVSRDICRKLRPEHHALVRRMATQLVALGKLVVDEIEFRERLRDAGVSFSTELRPMPVRGLGDPRERYSHIARWLDEAISFEFIGRDEVPAEWLARWEK